jgi:hypothetical protein
LVAGQKVLDQIKIRAPAHIQTAIRDLLHELQTDPYPRADRRNVAAMRGVNTRHLYVAWCDEARIAYRVAQDQPVILLVGVHWLTPPDGPDEGEDYDGWDFTLAA